MFLVWNVGLAALTGSDCHRVYVCDKSHGRQYLGPSCPGLRLALDDLNEVIIAPGVCKVLFTEFVLVEH